MSAPVRTRSFILQGRFREVSWSGLEAELVSGKIGKNGRATHKSFRSPDELARYVDREVAEALRRGFVECEPWSIKVADVKSPFEKRLDAFKRAHVRSAYLPVLELSDDDLSDASRFGGQAWLPPGMEHPSCPRCQEPMNLAVQLRRGDMPEGWSWMVSAAVLQLFLCDNICEPLEGRGDDAAVPATTVARHTDVARGSAPGSVCADVRPYPAKRLVAWTREDDFPSLEDIEREAPTVDALEMTEALLEQGEWPLSGDKLGGWPGWIAHASYASCSCGGASKPFLQVESEKALPIMLGDAGVGWWAICERCQRFAFSWQCT